MIPVFIEFFSGSARLAGAVRQAGWLAMRWDIMDGPDFDLTRPRIQAQVRGWLRARLIKAFHMGFPCESWSRARDIPNGPPRLRSRDEIWGVSVLRDGDRDKVRLGNILVRFTASFCQLAASLCVPFSAENPANSYAWLAPPLVRLQRRTGVSFHKVEYCQFGTPWRKSTAFLTFAVDFSWMCQFRCTGRGCRRTGLPHQVLSGTNAQGVFRTKIAEPYPPALCRRIARSFIDEQARARAAQFQHLISRVAA